jgi:hypothetical protein
MRELLADLLRSGSRRRADQYDAVLKATPAARLRAAKSAESAKEEGRACLQLLGRSRRTRTASDPSSRN